ncbi:MAG: hypothetical protein GDA48_13360 [Hormoscilla sp. GM102CHS1]|nr:hypothetical protein [Hormoscilla sp. GM102CHS1]
MPLSFQFCQLMGARSRPHIFCPSMALVESWGEDFGNCTSFVEVDYQQNTIIATGSNSG